MPFITVEELEKLPPWPTKEALEQMDLKRLLSALPSIPINHGSPTVPPVLIMKQQTPLIRCMDGTTLSVQASTNHYCEPRNNFGPYTHVEVGYPSKEPPDTWSPYAEEPNEPTKTIYTYIPIELVNFFIASHGGIDYKATFRDFVVGQLR